MSRLSPSSGLLYSEDVYSCTDDQDTSCRQHLSQKREKPNHHCQATANPPSKQTLTESKLLTLKQCIKIWSD